MSKELNISNVIEYIEDYINVKKLDVEFTPSGKSMLPIIVQDEDKVVLTGFKVLKKLDIVLCKRENGEYVLHRIIKIKKNKNITLCGDNQLFKEKNIDISQVIGKVKNIIKKNGTIIDVDKDFKYRSKVRLIIILRPFKNIIYRIKRKCKRSK